MRFQPVNPDTSKPNRHTLYLATSGGGKSQALAQNPAVPRYGARVIGWDQAGDHAGLHFTSKKSFLSALRAGLNEHANRGRGFRVFYAGPADPDEFEWWCEVVWSVLDGRHDTFLLVEELSAVCRGAGKAPPNAAVLLNQGRKYGAVFHATSQKPQEVAKTYYDNCQHRFIGQQLGTDMRRKMARELGIREEEIAALEPLTFLQHDGSAKPPEVVRLSFKKPAGVIWHD